MTFDVLTEQSSTLQVIHGNKYNKENVVDTKQRTYLMRPKAVEFHVENILIYTKINLFLLNSLDISVPLIKWFCFKHSSVTV